MPYMLGLLADLFRGIGTPHGSGWISVLEVLGILVLASFMLWVIVQIGSASMPPGSVVWL
jgi:hypothetical protein